MWSSADSKRGDVGKLGVCRWSIVEYSKHAIIAKNLVDSPLVSLLFAFHA